MRCAQAQRGVLLLVLAFLAGGREARADGLRLDWVTDGILAPASLLLAVSGEYLAATSPPPSLGAPDPADVPALDRLALLPYSRGADVTSTVLEISSIAAPLVLALTLDRPEVFEALVVGAEALLLAEGVKSWVKYLVPRYRPYVYTGGAAGVEPQEDAQSFPSGHATMAFAGATTASLLVSIYWPDSPWRVPVIAASYGVAAATATLRVLAGMHFITDVATGALIGSACAVGVTLLHVERGSSGGAGRAGPSAGSSTPAGLSGASSRQARLNAAVTPQSILVRWRY